MRATIEPIEKEFREYLEESGSDHLFCVAQYRAVTHSWFAIWFAKFSRAHVHFWHLADIDADAELLLSGLKQTLFRVTHNVR